MTILVILLCVVLTMFAGAVYTMSNSPSRAQAAHNARRAAQRAALAHEHARQVAEHRAYMSQRDKTAYPFHA